MLISLYIHFPFCLRKCLYCDFNSLAGSPVRADEYVAAVVREMALRAERFSAPIVAPTLYLGGGTPSLMAPGQVERVIEAAARLYGLATDAEITLEANPGTVTRETLAGYRAAGVNRLSLGVQSFNDPFLELLGRIHTAREAREAFAMARETGFGNIGIDLIHSLPGETRAAWLDDLARAVGLGPEHISAYGLTIEEGTPFHDLKREGKLLLPDEDEGVHMFRQAGEFLGGSGYDHYEVSNFALPGFRSRHNQVYWRRGNYVGFGAGAHSFLRSPGFGMRWRNTLSLETYRRAISRAELPQEELTTLMKRDAMAEFLFLGLRMSEGVECGLFRREFGVALEDAYPGVLPGLVADGLLACRDGWLRLTDNGVVFSNQVFLRFV
ncbi:MAG TPA: radical SAM family heme chaperone HemW [Geobacteraceae bacterium]|nr:radical SAM family heme chaperone HemW [Geobacteraceae bacterium]